jgi:uncharacterized membrane protein
MSVSGAVVILINKIGQIFGFSVDSEIFNGIVDGICGVLIVFGIITLSKGETRFGDKKLPQTQKNADDSIQNDKKIDTDIAQKNAKNSVKDLSTEIEQNKSNNAKKTNKNRKKTAKIAKKRDKSL